MYKKYTYHLYGFKSLDDLSEGFKKYYSFFKHGNKEATAELGLELTKGFLTNFDLDVLTNDIVFASSAYNNIPSASNFLMQEFVKNFSLEAPKSYTTDTIKLYRKSFYFTDYGKMSKEDRVKILDDFYVDVNFIKGKTLIVVDDVRITGSHETQVEKALEGFDGTVIFVYLANLLDDNTHAQIESRMNHYAVSSLDDMFPCEYSADAVKSHFHLVLRLIKFFLSEKGKECFDLLYEPEQKMIRSLMIQDGYNKLEQYKQFF